MESFVKKFCLGDLLIPFFTKKKAKWEIFLNLFHDQVLLEPWHKRTTMQNTIRKVTSNALKCTTNALDFHYSSFTQISIHFGISHITKISSLFGETEYRDLVYRLIYQTKFFVIQ